MRGDWGRGRGNACEINFKKPMPPTLDRRQRQRNMNPGSGQSKQESYVIILTEIGFTRELEGILKPRVGHRVRVRVRLRVGLRVALRVEL